MRATTIRRMHVPNNRKRESRMPKAEWPRSVTYWNVTPFIPGFLLESGVTRQIGNCGSYFWALLIDNATCDVGSEIEMQVMIWKFVFFFQH